MLLDHFFTIFVPGTDRMQRLDSVKQEEWTVKAMEFLATKFGGVTAEAPAVGGWITADGKFVREPVVRVTGFCNRLDYLNSRAHVKEFVLEMMADMGQEAASLQTPEGLNVFLASELSESQAA